MCNPKPLGRCANHLQQQYNRLLEKEATILEALGSDNLTIDTTALVQQLSLIEVDKQKNRIDWYANQRKKVQLSGEDRDLINQRVTFQTTAHELLETTKKSCADEREGLYACTRTANTIIATTEYDLASASSKYQNILSKLDNPLLSAAAQEKTRQELNHTYKLMLILEMNLADMVGFLKENTRNYERTYAVA